MRMLSVPATLAMVALCIATAQMVQAQAPASMWPRCIAERAGQRFSQAGSVCECGYDPGGTMVARPPGWRWTCDILRPDGSLDIPAEAPAARDLPSFGYGPVPDGFDDRRRGFGPPLGGPGGPPYDGLRR